ncbi:hypothetical protein GWI33_007176 [Rhynchophorus ferrugineus]|uniref:Uncharacterized protein n=1 Tax=Rhynchophorus ferrugineus TaxID=354439 RepID=A0A834IGM9_RHYFE|nr:hypothetical protein GWI33_007176 [Rhynchophorus ferrugineus]
MTKTISKSKSAVERPKPKISKRQIFKPNIRLANAIVGAIAFLQKTGFEGSIRNIKKCMHERSRKPLSLSLTQMPLYLNRGVELGILKKWHGSYKIGDFQLKRRRNKRKNTIKSDKKIEVIKEPSKIYIEPVNKSVLGSTCAV